MKCLHAAAVLAAAVLAVACGHRAAVRSPPASQRTDAARIERIQRVLDKDQVHTRRWWWSWWSIHSAMAVGQGAIAIASDDEDNQAVYGVGASGSLLGSVSFLFMSAPANHAGDELRSYPDATPEQREAKLAAAHRLLKRSADEEANQVGLLVRAGGYLVSATLAGILWLRFDLPEDAAINLIGGVITTELQIRTAPTGALRLWRGERGSRETATSWRLVVGPRAVGLATQF